MYKDIQDLLDLVENEASYGGDEGLSSFEADEAYEVGNYLERNRGYARNRAMKVARKAVKRPDLMRPLRKEMSANGGQGAVNVQYHDEGKIAATFTLKAERLTTALLADLPVAFFGSLDAVANYNRFIDVPSGLTLIVYKGLVPGVAGTKEGQYLFRYTDGVNTDDIVVTCKQAPYESFVASLTSDTIKMDKLRYSISDTTKQAQFAEGIGVKTASLFGKKSEQVIDPSSFKRPDQFQSGIVDLDGTYFIDKETALVHNLLNSSGANFSISVSFFATKFSRYIAK